MFLRFADPRTAGTFTTRLRFHYLSASNRAPRAIPTRSFVQSHHQSCLNPPFRFNTQRSIPNYAKNQESHMFDETNFNASFLHPQARALHTGEERKDDKVDVEDQKEKTVADSEESKESPSRLDRQIDASVSMIKTIYFIFFIAPFLCGCIAAEYKLERLLGVLETEGYIAKDQNPTLPQLKLPLKGLDKWVITPEGREVFKKLCKDQELEKEMLQEALKAARKSEERLHVIEQTSNPAAENHSRSQG